MGSEKGGGDRGYIDWKPNKSTKAEVSQLLTLINSYQRRNLPAPTARDLMYDMIGIYGHKKSESLERKVYRLLRKMRRSKMIGFDAITDDSEASRSARRYSSPIAFYEEMEGRAGVYEFDLRKNQPDFVVELFTEGKGKVQQLHQLTRDYHIPVRSPGGYDSITPKRDLALRAAREWEKTGRQTYVLHCGDFDHDGVELYKVFTKDTYAFLADHLPEENLEPEDILRFKRILTTYEQAIALPPERRATFDREQVKEKDHRGKRWPYPFSAQLESVGLENIIPVVKREIEALLDLDQLEKDREQSKAQREDILARVGPLLEEAEDAQPLRRPWEEEEDKVPAWFIEHLARQTREEINSILFRLPMSLSPRHRTFYTDEISKRLARRLRRGT